MFLKNGNFFAGVYQCSIKKRATAAAPSNTRKNNHNNLNLTKKNEFTLLKLKQRCRVLLSSLLSMHRTYQK